MKVTLDLDQLLAEEKISQAEYQRFSEFAARGTSSLAFNILIGFGVIAVSASALALVPEPATAIIIGALLLIAGLGIGRTQTRWNILANICILIGTMMNGGGIITAAAGSMLSFWAVTAMFTLAGIASRSSLLAVLATLMLAATIGARSEYAHANYALIIQQPITTVIVFTLLAIGLYLLAGHLSTLYQRIALASARTGLFLVNFGFWVGSLWGEQTKAGVMILSDAMFAILWALALLGAAVWAWKQNRRWMLNAIATFACIHFYTQWFERLDTSPGTVLIAGLLALAFAAGIRSINVNMKAPQEEHSVTPDK